MAFDFPASPAANQEFTPPGGPTYKFISPVWKLKNSVSADFVKIVGDTMTGDLNIAANVPTLKLKKVANGSNYIKGQKGEVERWNMQLGDGLPETGSGNVGSDFQLTRYTDGGALLGFTKIARPDGLLTHDGDATLSKSNPMLTLSKTASGQQAFIRGANGDLARWIMRFGDNNAESGANVGSGFSLSRYNDDGTSMSPNTFLQAYRHLDYIDLMLGQLRFPSVNNPTSSVYVLDDYEEGTWSVAWTATTAPAIGNGSLTGTFVKIGKTVTAHVYFVPGTTTTFGTGTWQFSLPFAAVDTQNLHGSGAAMLIDSGTGYYFGTMMGFSTTTVACISSPSLVHYNGPFAWQSGDQFAFTVSYSTNL